jgi:hypothetical protein
MNNTLIIKRQHLGESHQFSRVLGSMHRVVIVEENGATTVIKNNGRKDKIDVTQPVYGEDVDYLTLETYDFMMTFFDEKKLDMNIIKNEFYEKLEELIETYLLKNASGYRNNN